MKFLLDTDTVSFALRGHGRVAERLRAHPPSDCGVSAITVAELRFGASKRKSSRLHRLLDQFLSQLFEIPFDARAARRFGDIAAELAARGEPIGIADTMIAAHALELEVALVTHNTRRFQRVEGLSLVDWV